ncbi:MAG: LLM class flavin-dependent oxidoreductase, partial [Nitrospinae bacterium]|nr:LLM class flavin-dependent oxidoreductase [Nitrospinota bacterium]
MDFSLFYILYRPEDMTEAQVHEDMIVESILADELGYSCVWYAEHHFSRVGMIPDPLLICAAVAQKTEKIHVGTAISIMSFHDPIRLAEQAAMVDL